MRSAKARARILAFPIVVVGVVLVVGCGSSAGTQSSPGFVTSTARPPIESPTPSECPPAPCPGLVYEIVYRQTDGKIMAMDRWDANQPGAPRPGEAILTKQGEATLVIATDEYAKRIFDNMDAYFVNLNNRTVQPRPAAPVATPVAQQQ